MSQYWDISPIIDSDLAVFPGDTPFRRNVAMDFPLGHHLGLSSIETTVHIGAHADAPSHYHPSGQTMEKRALDPYLGPCQVVRAQGLSAKQRVSAEHVPGFRLQAPRLLVHTGSYPDPKVWNDDFNSFDPSWISELADQGLRLIGIDTPSVDPSDSKALETHQKLFAHDLAVLEGLCLSQVPEGLYFLVALPLALRGADASPVRAVLLPQDGLSVV